MASRFADINSVEQFVEDQENENTRKKTQQNVALLEEFLTLRNESRLIEEIAPKELNAYIAEFIITVRKKDGNEDYEPSSLRSLMASFERYLKKKNYGFSIMKDAEFEQARKALQSKQKDLKQKGKGNKPNASVALTEEEIKVLYDKELLGTSTPEALLNTIWFNNTIHFGLRGCKEHRNMCWGDVQLRQTTNGEEFLEYSERQTKTRTGENPRDVRQIKPKMFSVPGSEKDPVAAYQLYAKKRQTEMNDSDAPFYLAINNLGSISAALSCPVYVPPRKERGGRRSAGSFPEQRLEIEPILGFHVTSQALLKSVSAMLVSLGCQIYVNNRPFIQ